MALRRGRGHRLRCRRARSVRAGSACPRARPASPPPTPPPPPPPPPPPGMALECFAFARACIFRFAFFFRAAFFPRTLFLPLRIESKRSWSSLRARLRLSSLERVAWQRTTMPVGRCFSTTQFAVRATAWPPAPPPSQTAPQRPPRGSRAAGWIGLCQHYY